MGIRTTNIDSTGFIYDSVSGLAIGESWNDTDEMDKFLEWYESNDSYPDMRNLTPEELNNFRSTFHIHFWIKSST